MGEAVYAYTMAELEHPAIWCTSDQLEGRLRGLGCENRLAASRDFEAYGVCKFAAWTRYRCVPPWATFEAHTLRRIDHG